MYEYKRCREGLLSPPGVIRSGGDRLQHGQAARSDRSRHGLHGPDASPAGVEEPLPAGGEVGQDGPHRLPLAAGGVRVAEKGTRDGEVEHEVRSVGGFVVWPCASRRSFRVQLY